MVPPLRPDVAIVARAARGREGDTQIWGLLGCQKEVAFAADRVIVVVEEVVEESVIRPDPNRTVIPGAVVDAVVEEPFACHPSFTQGYYDRDNAFYLDWDASRRTRQRWRRGSTSGSTASRSTASTSRSSATRYWDALRPGARAFGRGRLREVRVSDAAAGRGLLEVRDDDRGERAPARAA